MKNLILASLLVYSVSANCHLRGEAEYLGAEKLLLKVAEDSKTQSGEVTQEDALRKKITALIENSEAMPAAEAADAWVAIFSAYLDIPASKRSEMQRAKPPLTLATVFEALPAPTAWDAIQLKIDSLKPGAADVKKEALQLAIAVLDGSPEQQHAVLAAMEKSYEEKMGGEAYRLEYLRSYIAAFRETIPSGKASPEGAIAAFEAKMSEIETAADPDDFEYYDLIVPDLTGIEAQKAESLILRMFKLKCDKEISHEPTRRLVAKVLLEHPDAIVKPLWSLIETQAEIPLFELFHEKFSKDDDWSKSEGESAYLTLLLTGGDFAKAKNFIEQNSKAGADTIGFHMANPEQDPAHVSQATLLVFFKDLLSNDPSLEYWDVYLELAKEEGGITEAIDMLAKANDSVPAGSKLKRDLERTYWTALLGLDRVDEGLAVLREIVRRDAQEGAVKGDEHAVDFLNNCRSLIRISHLLEKPEVEDEAFVAAESALKLVRKYSNSSTSYLEYYLQELVRYGRGTRAEEAIAEELVIIEKKTGNQSRGNGAEMLTALAYVYGQAGRHADVVQLLEKGTMWGTDDLSELSDKSFSSKPLHLIAAEALFAVGRKDEALKLVKRLMRDKPGMDAVYDLRLQIGGEGIIAELDALHASNRFEERPLIWKAKYLSDSGELDEAEKTIRAAIAIDPSDGEQGKGDRMRAYAVLSEIMEKKGDKEQAEFLRGVVQSIRTSEDGDDWWSEGMHARAIVKYEAALKQFADAYCIQSRLALRYSRMGDFDKAAAHYQRAFELMPDSFGRIESHCFGCEGAFSGKTAQSIAERVFLKLAKETPDKPQVFYLLGYLRAAQDRNKEAAEYYSKAVELDPLYINAWKNLGEVADEAGLSAERKDEIQLALFRLNPTGSRLDGISDFRKFWTAVLEAAKTYVPADDGPIFALKSSSSAKDQGYSSYWFSSSQGIAPRAQMGRHEKISAVIQIINTSTEG